ncbi:MAG TPA: IPTL-CTERM sorting domain-containing protein, partial [Thermoanaerobaculia bacterium]
NTGTNTVTWNGPIPVSGTVTITITATILPAAAGQTVSNQGSIAYDSNGDGTNESTAQTDDPGVAGAANPTNIVVPASTIAIPTLSTWGLLVLMLALAGLAFAALRRRRQV